MELIRIYIKELYRDLLSTYDIEHDERINELLKTGTLGAESHNDFTLNFRNGTSVSNVIRFQTIDPSKVIFTIREINLNDMYIEGTIPESKHATITNIPHMIAVPRMVKKNGRIVALITFDLKYIDSENINQTVMEIPIPLDYKNLVNEYDFSGDSVLQYNLSHGDLFAGLFQVMVKNSLKLYDGKNVLNHDYYDRVPYLSLSVATITKINPIYMTVTIKPNRMWNDILRRNIDRLVAIPRFSVRMNDPKDFHKKGLCTQSIITFDIDIRDIYPALGIDIKSKPKILEGGDG
ncbi:hypothetical protein [Bacteroides acidifaciens]|uniref:hypothetical protein n=1 Tax=Bacteroides acidifaciens TaxID=85831 RepID=UPI00263A80F0|nr:hypothetical protein [Bacteroides acidifaciens]